ncbi:MAG: LutB/LldF family L-lactate oxidation iron-sulfur protein [Anaerolineae bacterium]
MIEQRANNFVGLAEIAIHQPDLQDAVNRGTFNAFTKRINAMGAEGTEHGEALRQQASEAKRRSLRQLPDLLEQAEQRLTANGFTVLWARDAHEANQHVLKIAREHGAQTVAKSKSMLTEEIHLNQALELAQLRVVETDLGEYIIQLNHEPPSHIVAPVIHKTKAEIRDIFVRELGMTPTDDAGEMVAFTREKLRADFLGADLGISGGNFIIAETGSLGLVMNEGNGRMVTSLPDVHVALVGIEKIIANLDDYATLTQILPRSGTGQNLTVYTNIINGPRRPDEHDGPEHVYVILVDNGRSEIYATDYAEALACIRCGACQNACPVYRNVGGHAYGSVYAGPIGAVLTPLLDGLEAGNPLPHASSLCGACKQVCPVDIDLPRMLLDLRHDLAEAGINSFGWKQGLQMWALGMSNATLFEFGGKMAQMGQGLTDNQLPGVLGRWQTYRDFPDFAEKPFRQLWRERQQGRG